MAAISTGFEIKRESKVLHLCYWLSGGEVWCLGVNCAPAAAITSHNKRTCFWRPRLASKRACLQNTVPLLVVVVVGCLELSQWVVEFWPPYSTVVDTKSDTSASAHFCVLLVRVCPGTSCVCHHFCNRSKVCSLFRFLSRFVCVCATSAQCGFTSIHVSIYHPKGILPSQRRLFESIEF